jgi:hypothetical protein
MAEKADKSSIGPSRMSRETLASAPCEGRCAAWIVRPACDTFAHAADGGVAVTDGHLLLNDRSRVTVRKRKAGA